MALPPTSWNVITASSYAWKPDAPGFVRERRPEQGLGHAWVNLSFIVNGSITVADLVILKARLAPPRPTTPADVFHGNLL